MNALPPELSIRPATAADADALAALARDTFIESYADQIAEADVVSHLDEFYGNAQQTRELLDPGITVLLLCDGEELAGFAHLEARPLPGCVRDAGALALLRFYLRRRWHGKGAARPFLDAVAGAARARGARTLWLTVWEHNPRAIAFYRKCGLVDVGATGFQVGDDLQTDRVMELALA